jgi:tRNA(fMet)-specific endonuclease VapC
VSNYLIDTDIAIELLRGRNIHVAKRLASKDRGQIFLSSVTVAELVFGAMRSSESDKSMTLCRHFCSAFQIVGLDYEAAERSGVIRAYLEERGQRIGGYDMLIVGIALARDCVLATHNVREFGRVPELRIEDWTVPA